MASLETIQKDIANLEDDKEQQSQKKFQIMIELVRNEIESLTMDNKNNVLKQFEKMRLAYEQALQEDPTKIDETVYSGENLDQYGIDFLSYIDPRFV